MAQMDVTEIPLSDLVDRLRNRDAKAYTLLLGRWQHLVFGYAFRYSNDQYFAAEIAQKTFIRVFEKIDQLKDPLKLEAWIYKIADNFCTSEWRRNNRTQSVMAEMTPDLSGGTEADRALVNSERISLVQEVLQLIPEDQRKVIVMKEYQDLKFREIAEILEESENTVKSRMYYGLSAMRKIFIDKKLIHEV